MTIKISKEAEKELVQSIRRFYVEKMDEEISDLKAILLLDFALKEIGPTIYNRAVADAKAFMLDRVEDLDGSCFEAEFEFWEKQ